MKTFEELDAFQAALDLIDAVYERTVSFPRSEQYGLTSQMRRAAVSVASNIAEGQGRLTLGEWRQMLSQARGSLFELQAQVTIAVRLRYADKAIAKSLRDQVARTARPLNGLIKYVRSRQTDN
jgi:four helix bundle protein